MLMPWSPWSLVRYIIERYSLQDTTAASWVVVAGVLACMVIPYLLGSLNFGVILSRAKYKDDVRAHGSGNAGTTNMLRTYGKGAAVLTLLGDMLKAVVAMIFGYFVLVSPIVQDGKVIGIDLVGPAIAGLFVMLGHMFPCFFHFKGGKGVATAAMVVLMTDWMVFLILLAIFVIIAAGTKYVSLASIMGLIFYPIILYAFKGAGTASVVAVIMALLVVYMHRENIKRLRAGTESKLSFKKKPAEDTPADQA
jgi:glycerol-3-phosphate acyltransferase PlsY